VAVGDRIAHLLVLKTAEIEDVVEKRRLCKSVRAGAGFGSTGAAPRKRRHEEEEESDAEATTTEESDTETEESASEMATASDTMEEESIIAESSQAELEPYSD